MDGFNRLPTSTSQCTSAKWHGQAKKHTGTSPLRIGVPCAPVAVSVTVGLIDYVRQVPAIVSWRGRTGRCLCKQSIPRSA